MFDNASKSISIRLVFTVALSALLFIIASSFLLYRLSSQEALNTADHNLDQLVSTVRSSAAIAAYLVDTELAKEVVLGLSNNDIVSAVRISQDEETLYAFGDGDLHNHDHLKTYPLVSPFDETHPIGRLVVQPNYGLMQERAGDIARRYVLTMVTYTIIVLVILISLVNWQLTRPITNLARQLDTLKPGSANRLVCPEEHKRNEIGRLVRDTNELLGSFQSALEKEQTLRRTVEQLQQRFEFIIENANCGIALLDQEGRAQMYNTTFEEIFGEAYLSGQQASAQSGLATYFEDSSAFLNTMRQVKQDNQPIGLDLKAQRVGMQEDRWLHCLFSNVPDESSDSLVELIVYDVSERTRREEQAQSEAEHDPLTQLFNRRAGQLRMQDALDEAQAEGLTCAVMMVDLDRFKPVNDVHGHEAGDDVLIEVSNRLQNSVRGEDVVVRWGGDEFLIFLKSGHGVVNPAPVSKKILSQVGKPFVLEDGTNVSIGASIGVALFPQHATDLEQLVEIADQEMYRVKKEGGMDFGLPAIV